MIVTKKALPRRTFLRGAGVTLGLPLLDAMVPALTATVKTAASPAHRIGYFYSANGTSLPSWRLKTVGPDFEFSPTMKSLEPYRDYVTAISGLSNYQATLGSGGGVHTRAMASWMTGILAKPTEGSDVKLAMTADQYAAQVLGKETVLESLELGAERRVITGNCEYNYSCLYESTISWRSETVPNPIENNPRVVFERLFGQEKDAGARQLRLQQNQSILDRVKHELSGLEGRLGAADRAALEEYLQSVRDVERRIQKSERQAATSVTAPLEQPLGVPDTYDEHVRLQLDMLFLAYQADLTRVATFIISAEGGGPGAYPWIGVPEDHHSMSHHQNDPHRMAQQAKVDVYRMSLFAQFVAKMKAARDGDGTLLDHASLLCGSGMSDSDLHSPLDIPLVLVGHGCGTLKGNRHISYPTERKMPMTNLHITMLHKAGVPIEKLADSTGELPEL